MLYRDHQSAETPPLSRHHSYFLLFQDDFRSRLHENRKCFSYFYLHGGWSAVMQILRKCSSFVFISTFSMHAAILFYMGVLFAYLVVTPLILQFLVGIAPENIAVMTDINQFLNFMLKLLLAFGIAFQVPVATYLTIKSGIKTKDEVKALRPYLIVVFFVVAMLLTPPDIFSQLFLALPMWLLFELGLLFSKK